MKRKMSFVAAVAASGITCCLLGAGSADNGGGAPYTPTRGEWLCVLLNMDEAAANDIQIPEGIGVRYEYDLAKPDTIQIEVVYTANVSAKERKRRGKEAEQQARELARLKGWDGWLKTELKETKYSEFPTARPLED
jgi:hypothetical protein